MTAFDSQKISGLYFIPKSEETEITFCMSKYLFQLTLVLVMQSNHLKCKMYQIPLLFKIIHLFLQISGETFLSLLFYSAFLL